MDPFAEYWASRNPLERSFASFARLQPNQAAVLGLKPGQQAELVTFGVPGGARFTTAKKVAPQFSAFLHELASSGYTINPKTSGGYNYRNIAGTPKLSQHAYGNAIDLNWDANPQGQAKHNLPANVGELAAKHGLAWGGNFSRPDPMHFEASRVIEGLPDVTPAAAQAKNVINRVVKGGPMRLSHSGGRIPTGMEQSPEVQQMPGGDDRGYFSRLFGDPMFTMGLSVLGAGLSGRDAGSAMAQGAQVASSMGEMEDRRRKQAAWSRIFGPNGPNTAAPLLKNVPAELLPLIQNMGPEEGMKTLTQLAFKRMEPRQLTKVGPGETLYDERSGQSVYTAPPKPDETKAPSGYRFTPDQSALEAIPGGPATQIPADQAGRLALMRTARQDFESAKQLLGPDMSHTAKVFNYGETGGAERTIKTAIEATLRAMTGAAAPQTEVENYEKMFGPTVWDSAATRQDKMRRLEAFITEAESLLTQGRGAQPQGPRQQTPAPRSGSVKTMSTEDLKKGLGF